MELASIQNLTFTYPQQQRPVLRDVTLSLRSGDFAVLAGASGCGKSPSCGSSRPSWRPTEPEAARSF